MFLVKTNLGTTVHHSISDVFDIFYDREINMNRQDGALNRSPYLKYGNQNLFIKF